MPAVMALGVTGGGGGGSNGKSCLVTRWQGVGDASERRRGGEGVVPGGDLA